MKSFSWWVLALVGFGLLVGISGGCTKGDQGQQVKTYEIPMKGPLDQAKSILENYAKGGRMGSEAAGFDALVKAVRETDPAKADILQKGFAELQKTPPQGLAAKAKEILDKLGS